MPQAMHPGKVPQRLTAVMPISVPKTLGNVLSAVLNHTYKSARVYDTPISVLLYFFRKMMQSADPYSPFRIAIDLDGERYSDRLGELLNPGQRALLFGMAQHSRLSFDLHSEYVEDLTGDWNKSRHQLRLTDKSADTGIQAELKQVKWESPFGKTQYTGYPATGYPRGRFSLPSSLYTSARPASYDPKDSKDAARKRAEAWVKSHFEIMSPWSEWSMRLAELLLVFDYRTWNAELIMKNGSAGVRSGHQANDKGIGQYMQISEIMEQYVPLFKLYAYQGAKLHEEIHRKLRLHIADEAAKKNPALMKHEEQQRLWRDEFFNKIPLHPLLTPIATGLNSATFNTRYQTTPQDGYFVTEDSIDLASASEDAPIEIREAYERIILAPVFSGHIPDIYAVKSADFIHPRALSVAASTYQYIPLIADYASKLKWRAITAVVGELDFHGSEWVLCDGRGASNSLWRCVLGLSPLLSDANKKAIPLNISVSAEFNIKEGEQIKEYFVPQQIDILTPNTDLVYEQHYMPSGMLMGEEDALIVAPTGINEPALEDLLRHWANKQPRYVDQRYRNPAAETTNVIQKTDWDSYVHADDFQTASTELQSLYSTQTMKMPSSLEPVLGVDSALLAYSEKPFAYRQPVEMARNGRFLILRDDLDAFIGNAKVGGNILFDMTSDVSKSINSIDTLKDVIVVEALSDSHTNKTAGQDQTMTQSPRLVGNK